MRALLFCAFYLLQCAWSTNFQSILDNFQCWDEPKKNYFQNDPETEITDLPQIRLMMCGYESQCALEFVAYLFMKEKLGMNMTFHPTLDYDSIWNGEYWDNWASNADGASRAYPRNYFAWLANDSMDLNFEFWQTQVIRTNSEGEENFNAETEYFTTGLVDFGGFVGAYGEESVWVPQYWLDEYPTAFIPKELASNGLFREQLINASVYGGTDYVSLYLNETLATFDTASYDRPTVWGGVPTYYMSIYADGLTKNYPFNGGMDVNYVTMGSEGKLAELVADLYAKRLPFIANIYTLDINFGRVDAESGELQQFEKLLFPRNPDQSAYDPCYGLKICQMNVSPIMKAANPRLKERFPEAYEFFQVFQMGTAQINLLVSKFISRADDNTTTTEKWLNAACDWMKDNSSYSTWNVSSWYFDIIRTDCDSTCGINGHGGSCNYFIGECQCDYPEIFADTNCTGSCPGLIGPTLDTDIGDYTFEFCSGHGTCDIISRQCTCDEGYGDEGCSTKLEEYKYVALTAIIIALSSILAIVGVACIVWLRISAEYKTVKALSVNMTTLMTIGLIFLVCSNIALSVTVNNASCIAWQWLFGLGGVLAIMAPLLKAYRVSRVFHGGKMLRAVKITDAMLMATLIKAAILEMIICVGYTVSHQWFGGTTVYWNHDALRAETKCNSETITSYVSMGSYAYFFVILCALTYYSWGTRRALAVFKESTCAYFSSFLSLLCTLITFVFYMATTDPAFRVAVQSFAIIVVISAVFTLFYATRIYTFYTEPENRNVTDARAATHTSTSSHASVMKPGPSQA